MGLYARWDCLEAGYPDKFETDIEGQVCIAEVDYGAAISDMVATFMNTATSLVPVDTGYLQSTIDADGTDYGAEFYADAEYAEYVEFGTWKMAAQPYFTPAIDAAWEAWVTGAEAALQEAYDDFMEQVERAMEELEEEMMADQRAQEQAIQKFGAQAFAMQNQTGTLTETVARSWVGSAMFGSESIIGGTITAVAGLLLFFPIAVITFALEKEIQGALTGDYGDRSPGGLSFDEDGEFSIDDTCPIEIEIV